MLKFQNIFYLLIPFLLQNFLINFVRGQLKTSDGGFIITAVNCTSLDIEFLNFTKCLVRKNFENKNVVDIFTKIRRGLFENITVRIIIK